jgi:hypothetical protein
LRPRASPHAWQSGPKSLWLSIFGREIWRLPATLRFERGLGAAFGPGRPVARARRRGSTRCCILGARTARGTLAVASAQREPAPALALASCRSRCASCAPKSSLAEK